MMINFLKLIAKDLIKFFEEKLKFKIMKKIYLILIISLFVILIIINKNQFYIIDNVFTINNSKIIKNLNENYINKLDFQIPELSEKTCSDLNAYMYDQNIFNDYWDIHLSRYIYNNKDKICHIVIKSIFKNIDVNSLSNNISSFLNSYYLNNIILKKNYILTQNELLRYEILNKAKEENLIDFKILKLLDALFFVDNIKTIKKTKFDESIKNIFQMNELVSYSYRYNIFSIAQIFAFIVLITLIMFFFNLNKLLKVFLKA